MMLVLCISADIFSICVQMEPHMEGKKYNGITIMEET